MENNKQREPALPHLLLFIAFFKKTSCFLQYLLSSSCLYWGRDTQDSLHQSWVCSKEILNI